MSWWTVVSMWRSCEQPSSPHFLTAQEKNNFSNIPCIGLLALLCYSFLHLWYVKEETTGHQVYKMERRPLYVYWLNNRMYCPLPLKNLTCLELGKDKDTRSLRNLQSNLCWPSRWDNILPSSVLSTDLIIQWIFSRSWK